MKNFKINYQKGPYMRTCYFVDAEEEDIYKTAIEKSWSISSIEEITNDFSKIEDSFAMEIEAVFENCHYHEVAEITNYTAVSYDGGITFCCYPHMRITNKRRYLGAFFCIDEYRRKFRCSDGTIKHERELIRSLAKGTYNP